MRTRSGRQAGHRSDLGPLSTVDASPPVRCVNAYWAGTEIIVLARGGDGDRERYTVPVEHASFLKREHVDTDLLRQIRASRHVRGVREEGDWLRVSWWTRGDCLRAASRDGWFARQEIPVYEADVDPVRRWMVDNGVELQRPRRGYTDIETDSRVSFAQKERARILCWALVSDDGEYERTAVLEADSDEAERKLLEEYWRELVRFDQVVAWNGDPFDFPMLEERSRRLGILIETRRWLWLDHLPIFKRLNAHAAESGDEKQSMALGKVAGAVLGPETKKLIDLREVGAASTWDLWLAGGESRDRLVAYCLDDTRLMKRIEERTGYLSLHQTVCELTGTLPDTRGGNPTRYVEGFLMKLARERGIRFPTWFAPQEEGEDGEGQQQFKGAFVLEPTKLGLIREVHVADFSRLYPSIIMSWNMGLETHRPDIRLTENADTRPTYLMHLPLKRFPLPEGHCVSADEVVFSNEPRSILALALDEILRLRAHWDDITKKHPKGSQEWEDAERRSSALKILANAMYGVVGSVWSRFYVPEIAQAVTQTGVFLNQQTIAAAEKRGYRAIYGDTDSTFIAGAPKAAFEEFVSWCNAELFPKLTAEKGVPAERYRVKLAYEKAFSTLLMMGKKRYAGRILHHKGVVPTTPQLEVKGLEYKRGDTIRLARRMQRECIERMLVDGCEDPAVFEQLVMRWRTRVLEEPLELADIVLAKGLAKGLREYVRKDKKDGEKGSLPPHVEVAIHLAKRGKEIRQGVRIEYFVLDAGATTSPTKYAPAEDWEGECDRFYVWEQQVYPPTQRVLEAAFPAMQWRRFEKARPPKQRVQDAATGLLFAPERQQARPVGQVVDGNPGSHSGKAAPRRADVARQGKLPF